MIDRDDLQQRMRLARSGLSAPAVARARVRARLGESGAPASSAAELESMVGASGAAFGLGERVSRGTAPLLARVRRLRWGSAARAGTWLALGLCAGYWLGFHRIGAERVEPAILARNAAPEDGSAASASTPSAPRLAPPSTTDVTGPAPAGAEPRRRDHGSIESTASSTQPARDGVSAADSASGAPSDGERATVARALPPARAHTPLPPAHATRDTFAAELALLERAERAIRAEEGALALSFLAQLDREFPATSLREERRAARVLARCVEARSGNPDERARARAGAEEYLARSSSLYAGRVQQLCELGSDR